jgi:four helix bundle protein
VKTKFRNIEVVMSRDFITKYQELRVYQLAFEAAMSLRELEYELPEREKTLLAEPMLLAARLVFIHVAAAWHKRYAYRAFITGISEAAAQAAKAQSWIEFAVTCGYFDAEKGQEIYRQYDEIITALGRMSENASAWLVRGK